MLSLHVSAALIVRAVRLGPRLQPHSRWAPPGYGLRVNSLATLLMVAAVLVAIIDWIAVATETKPVEYIAKPAVMILLIGAALAVDLDQLGDLAMPVRITFVVALLLSLGGDVLLVAPRDWFIPGLTAFLLAHIAYIVGFTMLRIHGDRALMNALTIIGTGVVLVGVGWLGRDIVRGAGEKDERLRAPVAAYVAVISLMVIAGYSTRLDIVMAGALLFYASDSMLGWNRFVSPIASGSVLVMISYHIAQILFVLGMTVA